MSDYITFSLYGHSTKYCEGALRNVALAKLHYPGWECAFWCARDVPGDIVSSLEGLGAWVLDPPPGIENPMFWRFLGADLPGCQRFIARDTDSRPSEREASAVGEWILSGKLFHSMRDHPAHAREINGGLWGCVAGAIPNMRELIIDHDPDGSYGADQLFLCSTIWPLVKRDCLQHDSVSRHLFPGSVKFPTKRNGSLRFVGEVIEILPDGSDSPRIGDFEQIDGALD